MKKIILIIFLFLTVNSFVKTNLLINGGFEMGFADKSGQDAKTVYYKTVLLLKDKKIQNYDCHRFCIRQFVLQ
jgi:hypothetical protein